VAHLLPLCLYGLRHHLEEALMLMGGANAYPNTIRQPWLVEIPNQYA
jgi:hypothetical protein